MKIIAVCSHKGGVGKTSLSVHLAAIFANMSLPTLLIDLSPQADATCHLGVKNQNLAFSVYNLITDQLDEPIKAIQNTKIKNLFLIPSDKATMTGIELEMSNLLGREVILSEKIRNLHKQYEYVIIDSPPGSNILTINALMASHFFILPIQAHYLSLNGLDQIFKTVFSLQHRLNHKITLLGLLCNMVDQRTRLCREIENELRLLFGKLVLNTIIYYRTSIGEAPTFGITINQYKPNNEICKNYETLALELLERLNEKKQQPLTLLKNTKNSNAHYPESNIFKKAGNQLRENIQGFMDKNQTILQSNAFKSLSSNEEIKEYRQKKRASLTQEEAAELWK